MNGIEKARKLAGLNTSGAAAIIGVTVPTWYAKEKDPLKFTIGQFLTLYKEMDSDAQDALWNYLEGLKDGVRASTKNFEVTI